MLAVDDLDLDVRPGDIYGFLGANGSGKTTTVRMLLGLVLPTSGTHRAARRSRCPRRRAQVLPRVGALVEGPAAYGHLSGRANLTPARRERPGRQPARPGGTRSATALERVGLAGVGQRPVKAYSLGMRQRLGLAAALLRSPDCSSSTSRRTAWTRKASSEIRDLLLELNAQGTTVFLSSHLLAEVEQPVPGSASSTAAGWCCRRSWTRCAGRPAARSCARRMSAAASALLGIGCERHDGDRLVVAEPDAAA